MSVISDYRLDIERLALLRSRIEEVAQELGYFIGDVDIHEYATDTERVPYLTVEFKQAGASALRIADPHRPGVDRILP